MPPLSISRAYARRRKSISTQTLHVRKPPVGTELVVVRRPDRWLPGHDSHPRRSSSIVSQRTQVPARSSTNRSPRNQTNSSTWPSRPRTRKSATRFDLMFAPKARREQIARPFVEGTAINELAARDLLIARRRSPGSGTRSRTDRARARSVRCRVDRTAPFQRLPSSWSSPFWRRDPPRRARLTAL